MTIHTSREAQSSASKHGEGTHVSTDPAKARAAAAHLLRIAKIAADSGHYAIAKTARNLAEVPAELPKTHTAEAEPQPVSLDAEAARAKQEWMETTLAGAKANIARFHETGEDQMVVNTPPHLFNRELFTQIFEEAGAYPQYLFHDYSDRPEFAEELSQRTTVPVPADVQKLLNLGKPEVAGLVWNSPMEKGGSLYLVEYEASIPQSDGTSVAETQIMLIASNHELPDVE